MALLAGRSIGIILAVELSMSAGCVQLANFLMARGAVHSVFDGFARPYVGCVDFRVALAAGNFAGLQLAVSRVVYLVRIHVHGLPVTRTTQLFVGVAMHAVGIGHS